jgi:polygalacturonase
MSGFNVRECGAVGDGVALDTPAIQACIDACHAAGGGTVIVPAGRYLTGAISLRSNITLQLEAGAVLLGSERPDDYPVIRSRWEGSEQLTYAPLIGGMGLVNVAITGRGTVDGQGAVWWQRKRDNTLEYPRPRLISFANCTNPLIEGITVTNSQSWTIHPVACENVMIDKVTVINPSDSPNTDGINPDSCNGVRISNCYISVGDDCITLKSGTEALALEQRTPCQNITITNCILEKGHGGVVIGSEMSGGVRNVVISNCIFNGTDRGIRLKSRRGRGGVVEDVRVSNIIMTGVACPLTMNLYYHIHKRGDALVSDKNARPIDDGTPYFRRIALNGITAREVTLAAAFIYGLAERPVEDLSLSDISISMASGAEAGYAEMADGIEPMQAAGLYINNAVNVRLHNVDVIGQNGPAMRLINVRNALVQGSTPIETEAGVSANA